MKIHKVYRLFFKLHSFLLRYTLLTSEIMNVRKVSLFFQFSLVYSHFKYIVERMAQKDFFKLEIDKKFSSPFGGTQLMDRSLL